MSYKSIEIRMAKVFMDRKDIAKRIVDSELALGRLVLKEAEDKRAVEEYQNKLKLLRSDSLVYIASYRIIKTSLIDKIAILETSKIAVLLEKQKLDCAYCCNRLSFGEGVNRNIDPDGLTIQRINNEIGHIKSNCVLWVINITFLIHQVNTTIKWQAPVSSVSGPEV